MELRWATFLHRLSPPPQSHMQLGGTPPEKTTSALAFNRNTKPPPSLIVHRPHPRLKRSAAMRPVSFDRCRAHSLRPARQEHRCPSDICRVESPMGQDATPPRHCRVPASLHLPVRHEDQFHIVVWFLRSGLSRAPADPAPVHHQRKVLHAELPPRSCGHTARVSRPRRPSVRPHLRLGLVLPAVRRFGGVAVRPATLIEHATAHPHSPAPALSHHPHPALSRSPT